MQLSIRKTADLKILENQDQYENLFSCSLWYSKSANLRGPKDIRAKMKNHSPALNVTPNLEILLILRHMKISTKMKDHSPAVNETRNPRILLI